MGLGPGSLLLHSLGGNESTVGRVVGGTVGEGGGGEKAIGVVGECEMTGGAVGGGRWRRRARRAAP